MFSKYDYIIVGAGLYGSVMARLLTDAGKHVVVIDKRDHIGGNCYSKVDDKTGIEYHVYGSHIFHTSSQEVIDFISKFTKFNNYKHKVLSIFCNELFPVPVNLETINKMFKIPSDLPLSPTQAKLLFNDIIRHDLLKAGLNDFEQAAISRVGYILYKALIEQYTIKQWGCSTDMLPGDIIKRLPVRFNYDTNYFNDQFQGIPSDEYTQMFNGLLAGIDIKLNMDYFNLLFHIPSTTKIIFSGPIDKFFDYKHGKLKYRTVKFEIEYPDVEDFQGTSVINYPEPEYKHTRIVEPKHFRPEIPNNKTMIMKEYSSNSVGNDEYYPVRDPESMSIYAKYIEEAKTVPNVIFGGRLGTYQYLDMDKVILQALNKAKELVCC